MIFLDHLQSCDREIEACPSSSWLVAVQQHVAITSRQARTLINLTMISLLVAILAGTFTKPQAEARFDPDAQSCPC